MNFLYGVIDFLCFLWEDLVMRAIVITVVVVLGIAIAAGVREQREWEAFAEEHNCVIVGKTRSSTSVGVAPIVGGNGGVGVVTTTTPGQTGYECDDGVTYWR